MKKYFVYELKKSLIPFLLVMFAGIIMYVVPIALETSNFKYFDSDYIGYLMFVFTAACIIMPIWIFSYKMKRRSTDLYYSLPMTKTKQLAVHYIIGFFTIIAAFTVVYILGFLIIVLKYGNEPKLIYFLPLYFAVIIPAYIVYSISSFAYTRANSVLDGIIFIAFAMLALFLVMLFLSNFTKYSIVVTDEIKNGEGGYDTYSYTYRYNYLYCYKFFPFTPLDEITCVFQNLIMGRTLEKATPFTDMTDPEAINIAVSLAIYPAISIACNAGLFMTERNCKAENCSQISESLFGYKTMLPLALVAVCPLLGIDWFDSADAFMLYIIFIALIYLLAALYKKKFKIGWKYAVVLLCAAVVGTVCGLITGGIF